MVEHDRVAELLAYCTGPAEAAADAAERPPSLHALTSLELIRLRQGLLHEHATDVPLKLIYGCADVEEFAALLKERWGNGGPAGQDAPTATRCTVAEENIWLADMFSPGSGANHELYRLTFTTEMPTDRLEAALRACVRDFPALRTAYRHERGRLVRQIVDADCADFRMWGPDGAADAFQRRPFDLAEPLKIRARRLPGDPTAVLLNIHHIAVDAAAVDALVRCLAEKLDGQPPEPRLRRPEPAGAAQPTDRNCWASGASGSRRWPRGT